MSDTPSEVHTPLPWNYCKPNAKWLIYADCAVDDGIDFFVADVRNNEGRLEEAKANAALIVTAVNEYPKLLERVRVLEEALQARVMRPIEELPDWDHRPIRQFIRVEGAKEHSGESWHRVWFDVAYIERDAPFGYRQSDMERARKDGGMDYIERVTHWAPAVFGVSNDTFAALKAE